jgi:hypothetical protein
MCHWCAVLCVITGVHQYSPAASWRTDVCAHDDQQAVCQCVAVNSALWAHTQLGAMVSERLPVAQSAVPRPHQRPTLQVTAQDC